MAPIVSSIEIARPPGEVFAYVGDPSRLAQWQESVVSSRMEGGPYRHDGRVSRCSARRWRRCWPSAHAGSSSTPRGGSRRTGERRQQVRS
jgi:hypothetical protein